MLCGFPLLQLRPGRLARAEELVPGAKQPWICACSFVSIDILEIVSGGNGNAGNDIQNTSKSRTADEWSYTKIQSDDRDILAERPATN